MIDYTRGQRSLGPQTSTPLVTSSQTGTGVGGIKIEKIPAPSPLAMSSRTPARPVPAPRSEFVEGFWEVFFDNLENINFPAS